MEDLHATQLRRYGGLAGQRERGALEAAAARPQMTFGGEDLYADLAANAAGSPIGGGQGLSLRDPATNSRSLSS